MYKLLYIDLFCGAGGTSTGVETARIDGKKLSKVIACVNHDANAIASHAANHPEALHFTEDIRTLDLSRMYAHLRAMRVKYPEALVVLWASLECTNFSKAKGGQSRDADSRTLAEHLFRYIDAISPDYIQIENVEEFMGWGEIDENGKPISTDKGKSYLRWVKNIKAYGYAYQWRILNSADFGAYTARKRYFGQFAKTRLPISWPEPTHSKEAKEGLFERTKKWKAVREVLDLKDEGESIFTRKKPLSDKTLERIHAGLIKFVAGGKNQWLLKYNSINGKTGKHIPPSIDEPSPVVSCQGRLGVVSVNFLSKYYSGHPDSKNISINGPAHTIKCKDNHALISAKFISAYYGNGDNVSGIDSPAPTVTTKDRFALVTSHFFMNQYSCSHSSSIDRPSPTLLANPKQNLVTCRPWLMNTNFNNVGSSLEQPSQVITANRKWHYLIHPQHGEGVSISPSDSEAMRKVKEFMLMFGLADIRMRMLRIPELKRIMGFPADYELMGNQGEQKKYIGNAVEVTTSRALCVATIKGLLQLATRRARRPNLIKTTV